MQPYFYADKLDLLKWGSIVSIAKHEGISYILQVPFPPARPLRPIIYHPSESFAVDEDVWQHFRSPKNIERLGEKIGLHIEYFEEEVGRGNGKRMAYLKLLLTKIQSKSTLKKILLLDPDTGIEPPVANSTHVTKSEIATVWSELSSGDWLSVYQHRPMRPKIDWIRQKAEIFEEACRSTLSRTYTATLRDRNFPAVLFAAAK